MGRHRRRHRRGSTSWSLAALAPLAAVVAGGCLGCGDPPRPPVGPQVKGTVHVRAMTDAAPIRMLAAAGDHLFAVGTHGLDRWSPATGQVLPLSANHGLPGDRVLAVAADAGRRWLWVATDGGLGYYDVARETFTEVPSSRLVDLPAAGEALRLAPAADGGVWIGHPKGLYYVNPAGQWTPTPITGAIGALGLGDDGWLWIGTEDGLVGRTPAGDSFRYGPAQGLEIARARLVARAPGGGVMVIGETAAGKQQLAIKKGDAWASFKVSPHVTLEAIVADGDRLIARGGQRLYAFGPVGAKQRRVLTRDGVRLLPVGGDGAAAPPVTIELLPAVLPADPTAIAVAGDLVYVGTRDLGIGAWKPDASQPLAWLRRRQLVAGASTLTVACHAADDCWVATGTRQAWRFDGHRFEPSGPEAQVVLAVTRADDGALYALHRSSSASTIDISRIDGAGATWTPVEGVQIETPGERPEASFARFGPGGVLWVGLRYRDGADVRPWGVALVDLEVGAIAYHHETSDRHERQKGVLPVPIDVVDGGFDGEEAWFATGEGVARLAGDQISLWNEATGLASEVTRAIAVSPGGLVFVATGAGVGVFDGEGWSFPRELSFPVNDLAIAADGKLWMATDRGVAVYDGAKVRRVDVRRGLLENEIVDIQLDPFGRVWARSAGALTLITP